MAKTIDLNDYLSVYTYTQEQIDTKLAAKAASVHSHDDLYYTEDEIDSMVSTINGSISDNVNTLEAAIALKADASAMTEALAGKSDTTHNHTGTYAPISHTHSPADVIFTTGADATKTLTTKIGEIDSAISALQSADWDIQIVTSLPQEGTAGTLYFLHDQNESTSGANAFDEYIYDATNERFEKIGQRKIDLSGYITDVDIELSSAGVISIQTTAGSSAFAL